MTETIRSIRRKRTPTPTRAASGRLAPEPVPKASDAADDMTFGEKIPIFGGMVTDFRGMVTALLFASNVDQTFEIRAKMRLLAIQTLANGNSRKEQDDLALKILSNPFTEDTVAIITQLAIANVNFASSVVAMAKVNEIPLSITAREGIAIEGGASNVATSNVVRNVDEFVATLPRKATPANSPANLYDIKHTGRFNYTVSGGGAKIDIDGFSGSTILEAKFVSKPGSSPFIPGSNIPDTIRGKILTEVQNELTRIRKVIESGETPFKSVEIITNTVESKAAFEAMLKELSVPGTVRLAQ